MVVPSVHKILQPLLPVLRQLPFRDRALFDVFDLQLKFIFDFVVPFIGLIFALQMPCAFLEWLLAMERAVGKGNLLGRDDIIRNLPRHSSWLRWYQRRPIGSSPPLLSEVNGGESGRNFNV